jgi:16S rRNA (cytosine967-C5)-methyltransferase
MKKRRAVRPGVASQKPGGQRRAAPHRSREDRVRAAAGWVLERTLASSAPVDSFLDPTLARYDERDQGLLRELVLGSLRWLRRLDQIIEQASDRRLEAIEKPLWAPLRLAVYQLLFLDRIPSHAAVHEAVEQAHHLTHRGGASFVNAVLRRIARDPDPQAWPVKADSLARQLAIEMSHPDFLVERWLDRFGEETTRAVLAANNQPKPLHLLAFRDRGGRELLAERLIDEGLEIEPSALSPLGLIVRRGSPFQTRAFAEGDCYIQDEASQVAAWIPPPQPGERIFDAAAAPGGKSFALAAYEPSVRIVAGDSSLARLARLRENSVRLRRELAMVATDAGAPALSARFDRVLLDLPCAGTGTLRKHPELKWRISPEEVSRLARQGQRLVSGAAQRVAPGGLLVAATCSIEEEENEAMIARFLRRNQDFELLPLEGALEPTLSRALRGPGSWRLLPAGDHDGFTVHVLRRIGGPRRTDLVM